jgi:hypothetical protein
MSDNPVKTMKTLTIALEKALEDTLTKTNMKRYAKSLADDIKKRTRLGRGVLKNFGKTHKLKPLTSNEYIEQRYDDKEAGILSQYTSPERSNLTRTGQLLDAIQSEVINNHKFEISVKDNRRGRDEVKNSDIVEGQEGQGRSFLYASDLEFKRVRDQFRKDLQANMLREIKKVK